MSNRPMIDCRAAGNNAPVLFWKTDTGATVEVDLDLDGLRGDAGLSVRVDGVDYRAPLSDWVDGLGALRAMDRDALAGLGPDDVVEIVSDGTGLAPARDREHDRVNTPAHYVVDGLPEPIQVVERLADTWGRHGIAYHVGNAIEYVWRLGRKGDGDDLIADLRKAAWYLLRAADVATARRRGEDAPSPSDLSVPPVYPDR